MSRMAVAVIGVFRVDAEEDDVGVPVATLGGYQLQDGATHPCMSTVERPNWMGLRGEKAWTCGRPCAREF